MGIKEIKMNNIQIKNELLNEFKLSPLTFFKNLTPYMKIRDYNVPGITLYSSPKIEKISIKQINKSKLFTPLLKQKTSEGIQNKNIIIGYINPSKTRFIFNRIKETIGIKSSVILGAFLPTNESVYIILDENVNIFGSDIIPIETTILHELYHYAAYDYKNTDFIKNTIQKFLYPYYRRVIGNFLLLPQLQLFNEISKKDVVTLIDSQLFRTEFIILLKKLISDCEASKYKDIDDKFLEALGAWTSLFDNIGLEKSIELGEMFLSLYYYNYLNGYSPKLKYKNNYKNLSNTIHDICIDGYKALGLTNIRTYAGQELLFPSEVLSISNQNGIINNSDKIINKIKFK